MFCMNCGAELPEGAKFCMNCGTQIGTVENKKIVPIVKKEQKLEVEEKEVYVKFELLDGMTAQYVEGTEKISKYMGIFIDLGRKMHSELWDRYLDAHGIREAIEKTEEGFYSFMGQVISKAVEILGDNGIYDIGQSRFTQEYMQKYFEKYENSLEPIITEYFTILDDRDAMTAYREAQKASRSRWVGGGFGLKGAVKGSIQASMLNAGSDLFHGIGDSIKRASDNSEIKEKLDALYNKNSTEKLLYGYSADYVLAVYYELRGVLINRLHLSEKSAFYDKYRARELFNDTIKSNYPSDRKKENIIKCIELYPAEDGYYEAIAEDILRENKEEVFLKFLDFWGINRSFYDSIMKKAKKEYDALISGKLSYSIYEKKENWKLSNMIDEINNVLSLEKGLKDYIHHFNGLAGNVVGIANEHGNVSLFNKMKIYLQEKEQYTCPIILYIDKGEFLSKGQRGIAIGTSELIFLSDEDRIYHLRYEDIEKLVYLDGENFCFNNVKAFSWSSPNLGTDETCKALSFIILKVLSRKAEGSKFPVCIG